MPDEQHDPSETAAAPAIPEPPAAEAGDQPELPDEWKPAPREWSWKDVFTAPMLAFKPKCMIISIITLIALGAFSVGWWHVNQATADIPIVGSVLCWLGVLIGAVIFGVGATLVSIFFKADLLDDEFLSLKEACGQFGGRFKAAIMVPLFLIGVVIGFNILIYIGALITSIPVVGPIIYGLLYPLAWLLALVTVLLSIGVTLSLFVGPAVIAVRRHGWFDNVIDTFEAVGTRPHVLIANLVLTLILCCICYLIPTSAMSYMASFGGERTVTWNAEQNRPEYGTKQNLPSLSMAKTELGAQNLKHRLLPLPYMQQLDQSCPTGLAGCGSTDHILTMRSNAYHVVSADAAARMQEINERLAVIEKELGETDSTEIQETLNQEKTALSKEADDIRQNSDPDSINSGFYNWGPGLLAGFWQILLLALIVGYCTNVFLAGGMLTYLAVREDDYWDDEDLEDLDQLAKELEEEALRDQQAAADKAEDEAPKARAEASKADAGTADKEDGKTDDDVKPDAGADDAKSDG